MESETPTMYHGSLVALEGAPEVVSTQLRLLPTSPQLLILPSIHHYAKDEPAGEPFDARAFVRRIHETVSARREAALKFLEDSSPTRKRLVFLNGGTPGAQALCISAISEHETNGDVPMAETIFADLVRDGVAGLSDGGGRERRSSASRRPVSDLNLEEALTRAMLAAEALDRETEGLQPDDILDLTNIRGRPRSLSLPIYGFLDPLDENTPFFVFGAAGDEDYDNVPDTPALEGRHDGIAHRAIRGRIQTPLALEFPTERDGGGEDGAVPPPPRSPSCVGEAYMPLTPLSPVGKSLLLSSRSDMFCSPPPTPAMSEKVVFGEARVVQMRHSYPGRSVKKTRSLDDLGETYSRASPPRARPHPPSPSSPTQATTKTRETSPSRRHSLLELSSRPPWTPAKSNFLEVPQAKFVKASKTTIRRPVAHLRLNLHPRSPPRTNPKYVDRGTDAADPAADASPPSDDDRPFEPVLPLTEDLVIRFTDGGVPDGLLDSVIQGLKMGASPRRPATPDDDLSDLDAFPATPTSPHFPHLMAPKPVAHHHKITQPSPMGDPDEYDPFAPDGSYAYNPGSWAPQPPTAMPTITAPQPPTPAQTPPPPPSSPPGGSDAQRRFHDFSVAGRPTAVRVQNGLRSVLSGYFPPEDAGYHHCHFPLLPDMMDRRLWKPVFGEAEPASPRPDGRKTDLILAIGAQKGVKREFLSGVTAQIEKLGTKPNGVTRSGRLDLRYASFLFPFPLFLLQHRQHHSLFCFGVRRRGGRVSRKTNLSLTCNVLKKIPHRARHANLHSAAASQPDAGQPLHEPAAARDADHPPPGDVPGVDARRALPPARVPSRASGHGAGVAEAGGRRHGQGGGRGGRQQRRGRALLRRRPPHRPPHQAAAVHPGSRLPGRLQGPHFRQGQPPTHVVGH